MSSWAPAPEPHILLLTASRRISKPPSMVSPIFKGTLFHRPPTRRHPHVTLAGSFLVQPASRIEKHPDCTQRRNPSAAVSSNFRIATKNIAPHTLWRRAVKQNLGRIRYNRRFRSPVP